MTKTSPPPTGAFVVWSKDGSKQSRWKKIATVATHTEAVRLITSKGSWWISPLYDRGLVGNDLFASTEDPQADGHDTNNTDSKTPQLNEATP